MIKISRYTKLGFLIIACLAILIWGINYLKGMDIFKLTNRYYVVYEKIDGLLKSSAVNINGFQVGQVSDIEFLEDYSGRILVSLSVQSDFKLAKGSVARIVSSDIMGTRSIKIEVAEGDVYYASNDTIPGEIEGDLKEQVSMQVLPLKKKAEELIASMDSALTVVTSVFNQQMRDNLSNTFENINSTLSNIEASSAELKKIMGNGSVNRIVTNLDSITTTFNENSGKITNILTDLSAMSDSLSKLNITPLFAEISSTVEGINKIVQKMNTTESSAGLLVNDPELYNNLANLSESLNLLLKDIRVNPKRYVHFSAFNVGKDVYITSRPPEPNNKNEIVYKVQLISSPAKLSKESSFFKGLGAIEEMKISDSWVYLAGASNDFQKTMELLDNARKNFPDASLVAFKNGRKIKIEKALQQINRN